MREDVGMAREIADATMHGGMELKEEGMDVAMPLICLEDRSKVRV
jgi:hypothetical protein